MMGPMQPTPDPAGDPTGARRPDDAAAEAVDHLQRAGRELIAAARSFLDAAEQLVEDRSRLGEAAATLAGLFEDLAGRRGAGSGGEADLESWERPVSVRVPGSPEQPPAGEPAGDAAGEPVAEPSGPADQPRPPGGPGRRSSAGGDADRGPGRPRVRRIPVD